MLLRVGFILNAESFQRWQSRYRLCLNPMPYDFFSSPGQYFFGDSLTLRKSNIRTEFDKTFFFSCLAAVWKAILELRHKLLL